jgi:hypothetical protein
LSILDEQSHTHNRIQSSSLVLRVLQELDVFEDLGVLEFLDVLQELEGFENLFLH